MAFFLVVFDVNPQETRSIFANLVVNFDNYVVDAISEVFEAGE